MTRLIDHCRHGFRDRTNCRKCTPYLEETTDMTKKKKEPVPAPAAPDQPQGIYLLRTTPTVPHAYQRSIVIVANSSVSAREHLVDLYKSAIYEDSTSYEALLIGRAVTSKDQDPPRVPRIINDSGPAVGPDVQKAELLAELRAQSEWMVNEIRKYAGFRPNSGMNAFQQAVSVIDDLSDQVTKLNTLAHTRRMQRDAARRNADKGTDQ